MNGNKSKNSLGFFEVVWMYKYELMIYAAIISTATFSMLYFLGDVPAELQLVDSHTSDVAVSAIATTTQENRPRVATTTSSTTATLTAVAPKSVSSDNTSSNTSTTQGDLPIRVVIDKINVNTYVSNPSSKSNAVLNNYLLSGAVRYPGSGTLGNGNMFIFGHSTGIRVVNNQAYKAFNHIGSLAVGDIVRVRSATKEYIYTVTTVSLVESKEEHVDFSSNNGAMLTLSTCNVFGEKEQRYVVESAYSGSRAL